MIDHSTRMRRRTGTNPSQLNESSDGMVPPATERLTRTKIPPDRSLLTVGVGMTAIVISLATIHQQGGGVWALTIMVCSGILLGTAAIFAHLGRTRSATRAHSRVMHVAENDPALIHERCGLMAKEQVGLASAQDLQRGVFEVTTELVGCVDEADARQRFATALSRYWASSSCELAVWDRGSWRGLGIPLTTPPDFLDAPVRLPSPQQPDLVLDLSPAVRGQAALILRGASPQPSIDLCAPSAVKAVAEVLRGQFALSLRRVVLYGELQEMARTDQLTGACRRWYGDLRLREMIGQNRVLAIAMVDIDNFKAVNDRYGHHHGDAVLAAVGKTLCGGVRTGDLVIRTGGEEFLILLPDTDRPGAQLVAERLRSRTHSLSNLPCAVTISIGLTLRQTEDSLESLIARSDQACYLAKHAGRDQAQWL